MNAKRLFGFGTSLVALGSVFGFQTSANATRMAPRRASYPAIVEDAEPTPTPAMRVLTGTEPSLLARGGGHPDRSDGSPLETERQAKEAEKTDGKATPTPKPSPDPTPSSTGQQKAPAAQDSSTKVAGFDPVPQQQQQSVAGRLKIVEKLILDYGRAYDYRTYTTQQLEAILLKLQSENKTASLH